MLSLDDYLPSSPGVPRLVVGRDAKAVAHVLSDRLIKTLAFRLKDEWVAHAHIVITGGQLNGLMCDALQDSPLRRDVDWRKIHVWWTDEAFLPEGHIGRHETSARSAGIARFGIPESNLHPMPTALHADDVAVERGAQEYASLLRRFAPHGRTTPVFDVLLLDVGPLGEVGALHPGADTLTATETVVSLNKTPEYPKPRISLSLNAIRNAARVWLLASGPERAQPVCRGLTGANPREIPAAGAKGVIETKWWVDEAAARDIPLDLRYGEGASDMSTRPVTT